MRHLLLTILLSVSLALAAQDSAFVRINRQVQLFPQEKTHIHTDAADYYPADRIWLKVYLVDATSHKPLHYAPHVYAELLSPDASILRRVKIARRDSIFAGYIDIPEDAPAGKYALRAYTRYMTNTPELTGRQLIYIHSPRKADEPQAESFICRLFPEAGNLIAKAENLVAYEVRTPSGQYARNVNLWLTDETGGTVLQLDSTAGIGTFSFTPKAGVRYNVSCKADGSRTEPATMRCPKKSIGMHAVTAGDSVSVTINTYRYSEPVYLIAHSHALPFLMKPVAAGTTERFHLDSLPEGVVAFMLVNSRLRVLCQRLVYVPNRRSQLSMPLSASLTADNLMTLSIDTSLLAAGERADLSLSVTDRFAIPRHAGLSIMASLLLDADVADSYASPELVLLTRGWTRYNLPSVLLNYMAVPLLERTSTTMLQGSVNNLLTHKPVADAVVSLIVPQLYLSSATNTDSRGAFFFNDADLPEQTTLIVSASKDNKQNNLEINIREEDYPDYNGTLPRFLPDMPTDVPAQAELTDLSGNILLSEIEVHGKRTNETRKERHMIGLADISFGNEEIEKYQATCLHDLLRRIPGVFVFDNKCYIRANTSIFGDNPAAIALDGIILDGDYDLDLISMQDIARLDVFKTGNTVIWGARGGSGVISIILKDGTELPVSKQHTYIKRLTPLGWQQPQEFYVDFSDSSRPPATVYWNPDPKQHTLTFPVTQRTTRYDITLEGVTDEGRLIHEQLTIEKE
ncbi:MAG: TonB-dependent receptor plug domain-containing protein [Paludibacteraceae bacterium]|nr:TonB-dependent receptor plug domain-containing protein [Paludibacteraceae bacterium]